MSPKSMEGPVTVMATWGSTFYRASARALPWLLGFILVGILLIFAGFFMNLFYSNISEAISGANRNEIVTYLVSWIVLLLISFAGSHQIKEILDGCTNDRLLRRANQIAIMIALVLVIFLFKQPYLELLFGEQGTGAWLKAVLFGGGAISGWLIWYLKQIEKYGEFFHVFLLTIVIGFSWYARLTAPDEVQLTAVAFLLGSLFRIAKDYMDEAHAQS